ncbi:hypothetical protein FQR65_LT20441 [Abscondita terminalis]|nr:hypothetical protein FQR65_LT20441 [Abscondita terminalis]
MWIYNSPIADVYCSLAKEVSAGRQLLVTIRALILEKGWEGPSAPAFMARALVWPNLARPGAEVIKIERPLVGDEHPYVGSTMDADHDGNMTVNLGLFQCYRTQ